MKNELGCKVKKMRELMGLKQEYMAASIGISQSRYSEIESGIANITLERLEKISEVLNTTPEAIQAYDEKAIVNFLTPPLTYGITPEATAYLPQLPTEIRVIVNEIATVFEAKISNQMREIQHIKQELDSLRTLIKHKA